MTGTTFEDLVSSETYTPNEAAGSDHQTSESAPRPRLMPRHWSEIDAPSHRRAPLVAGLLDLGAMSVFYGAPGCGKTFAALDIAVHIAAGLPWRGRPVTRGPVVYVAAEGGLGIAERLAAARVHFDLSPKDADLYVVADPIDLCRSDRDLNALKTNLPSLPGQAVLIVIDTLARALAGGDENSSTDMGAFVQRCDELRLATGAHVLVVHHPGKDEARGARGHLSLKAAADTEVHVKRTGQRRGSMTVTKQRDHEDGEVFGFALKTIDLSADPDRPAVSSCVAVHDDAAVGCPARETMSRSDSIALKALIVAIEKSGHPALNLPGVPDGTRVVPTTLWNHHAMTLGISQSDNPRSRQTAFRRAKEKLLGSGKVQEGLDHAWLVDAATATAP